MVKGLTSIYLDDLSQAAAHSYAAPPPMASYAAPPTWQFRWPIPITHYATFPRHSILPLPITSYAAHTPPLLTATYVTLPTATYAAQ